MDDKKAYDDVKKGIDTLEFNQSEQKEMFSIVASVLHMGNVGFTEEEGKAEISKADAVEAICKV